MRPLRHNIAPALVVTAFGLLATMAPTSPLTWIAGVVLILALPGRALLGLLHPIGGWVEQLTVVLVGSITIVALSMLVLDAAGLRMDRTVVGVTLALLAGAAVALSPRPASFGRIAWPASTLRLTGPVVAAAAIVIVVVALRLGATPLSPPSSTHGYTELSIEPKSDLVSTVVVKSSEVHQTSYRLVVMAGHALLTRQTFELAPGGDRRVAIPAARVGQRTLKAVLYRHGAAAQPQRATLTLGAP